MSDNHHKTAVLYARVSTDEQASRGYSVRQQLGALRAYCASEGIEVIEEVEDAGWSGASLSRPGLDRVRDLVADEGVSLVLAQDRDRLSREPAYLYLLREEFREAGAALRGLNDRGDDSPEGQLTDGILDQLAKFERAKTAQRMRRGRLRKAREGKIIGFQQRPYGYAFSESRESLEPVPEELTVVRRVMEMVSEGASLHEVQRRLERDGIRTATGNTRWDLKVLKRLVTDDLYRPASRDELEGMVAAGQLSADVLARLELDEEPGVFWYSRRAVTTKTVREGEGYRKSQRNELRPESEWIAVPVPSPGIPRELADAARAVVADNKRPSKAYDRVWELSGVLYCAECGRRLATSVPSYHNAAGEKVVRFYYRCPLGVRRDGCSNRRNLRAEVVETAIWGIMAHLLAQPDQVAQALDAEIEARTSKRRGDPASEVKRLKKRLSELDAQAERAQDLAVEGLLDRDGLRSQLARIDDQRGSIRREIENLDAEADGVAELQELRDLLSNASDGEDYIAGAGVTAVYLLPFMADWSPEFMEEVAQDPEKLMPPLRQSLYRKFRLKLEVNAEGLVSASGLLDLESLFASGGNTKSGCTMTHYAEEDKAPGPP